MGTVLRQMTCRGPNCGERILFDIKSIGMPNFTKIKCNKCGKEWTATKVSSCCFINVKFVSIEINGKKPITFIQTYPKN